MSAKNEARARTAYVLFVIGLLLLLFGWFSDEGWSFFALPLGILLLFVGAVMVASVSIINGVPGLVRFMSYLAEPVWDGEMIHADGGKDKIRYSFDEHGSPWFVASDVCLAIGTKVPGGDEIKCGGVPLLLRGKNVCFSEKNIQTYLTPLAMHNHEANRLLVNIRNNVLRKLEKQRDENKLCG